MLAAHEPRPPLFTGRHGDRYYYRGKRWVGATNRVGVGARNARPRANERLGVWCAHPDGAHIETEGGLISERGAA